MRKKPILLILLFTFFNSGVVFAWLNNDAFPSTCQEFQDKRSLGSPNIEEIEKPIILTIPASLSGNGETDLKFHLNNDSLSRSRRHEDLCRLQSEARFFVVNLTDSSVEESISEEGTSHQYNQQRRHFMEDAPSSLYFTPEGYFHYEGHFYSPDEYCVKEISDNQVILKSCNVDCSANLTNTFLYSQYPNSLLYYSSSRVCIPKCCGLDETLSLEDFTCRKLNNSESFYFLPYLYFTDPFWFSKEKENEYEKHYTLVRMNKVSKTRSTWNSTVLLSGGSSDTIVDRLHFYRNSKMMRKHCGEIEGINSRLILKDFKFNNLKTPKERPKNPFRVEALPGHVQPSSLTRSRKWLKYGTEFCVDGADNWGYPHSKDAISQVVLMCSEYYEENDTDAVVVTPSNDYLNSYGIHWVYTVMSLFCCLLLLMAFSMHFALKSCLNLQGWVVMSHCLSLFLSYFVNTIGDLVFLGHYEKNLENANLEVTGNGDDENKRIGTFCNIIAILTHYFQLSVFFWLTAMNTTFWKFLRVPVLEKAVSSKKEAELTKPMAYRLFSLFSWGTPLLLVVIFVILDAKFTNPYLQKIVPDYAVETCRIASWSEGYYVHLPIAIIFGISFLCIVGKYATYCWKTSHEDAGSIKAQLKNKMKDEYFPSRLFIVVWCIQSVSWLITLLPWLEVHANNFKVEWAVTTLAFASLIVEPMTLVHIYCMNEHFMEKMLEHFPATRETFKLLQKYKLLWRDGGLVSSFSNCNIANVEADESTVDADDTVVIEGPSEEDDVGVREVK